LSAIPVSGQLFTRPGNFLNFHERLITYYGLIGQLASRRVRRPDIGSTTCNTIFYISNRIIRCILDSSWLYGRLLKLVFVWVCLSSVG
jgi:hypothetical protein